MAARPRLAGFTGFTVLWLGQLFSVLASQMTQFALTVWVYQRTGSATPLALVQVFFLTPFILITPFAGALVDRHNRKQMMMVSDLGMGLATFALLTLQALGWLQIWHLYAAAVLNGLSNAFQWPAYSAAISLMIPKAQYGRANGMLALVEMAPGVLAPLLAGALLPFIGLAGILTFDVATFGTALGALWLVVIPPPPPAVGSASLGGLWQDALFGFRYLLSRPSLLGLQSIFLIGNLFWLMAFTVLTPMILARTGNDERSLGIALSAGAVGGLVGGVLMSAWGGFRRRVHGVLLGWIWCGLLGVMLLGLGRDLTGWAVALFLASLPVAIIDGSNQAIYQAKVAPEVQGRVFAARRLIAGLTNPIAPLIAGPLADYVLEPQMRAGGGLAGLFGGWVGTGPGAGMALLIVVCGALAALSGGAGYLTPAVRNVDQLLLDHDQAAHLPSADITVAASAAPTD